MTCPSKFKNTYFEFTETFVNASFFKDNTVDRWRLEDFLQWKQHDYRHFEEAYHLLSEYLLALNRLKLSCKQMDPVMKSYVKQLAINNKLSKRAFKMCWDMLRLVGSSGTTIINNNSNNSTNITSSNGTVNSAKNITIVPSPPTPLPTLSELQRATAVPPPQQQEEPETESSPSTPSSFQQTDIDSNDQVYLQPDKRKLLFSLAYYFESGEQEKLDKLLAINKETMEMILDSSDATFGGMMDAEAGRMLKNYGELKNKKDLLYLRLLLSHIISDMSLSMSRRLKRCLGNNGFDDLIASASQCFDLDRRQLDEDTEAVMDDVVNLYHEEGIIAAKIKLCDVKKQLLSSRPHSNSFIAIEALEYIVSHIESWNKPGKSSEADYYARFSGLFEVVFQDVSIKMTSGETTSTSTKSIRTYNESLFGHTSKNGVFGRKIDGIICYKDLELGLCEYKPPSVSSSTLLKQQVKNLRSNSCVFHHLQALAPESDDLHIYGMDWRGTNGTMYVMKNIDNVMVATNVGKLVIPDDPMELDCIKSTLSLLFSLKHHLLKLTRRYRSLQQARKRQFEDLDDLDDENPSGFTTPPTSDSPLVFFSPMKRH